MVIVISGLIWIEKLIYPGGKKDTDMFNTRPSVGKADASVIISSSPLEMAHLADSPIQPDWMILESVPCCSKMPAHHENSLWSTTRIKSRGLVEGEWRMVRLNERRVHRTMSRICCQLAGIRERCDDWRP